MKLKDLKFTPGPWKHTSKGYGGYYEVAIETVAMSHNKTFIGEIGGGMHSNDEVKHNAILISRAPEMLEKLKKAEDALQGLFLPMKGPSAFLDAQSKCKETLKEITDLLNS